MPLLAADPDFWRYQAHPEVWLIVAVVIGFGYWVTRVIGPKAVKPGEAIVTRRQRVSFVLAVFMLWLTSDWPMHDISEEYLYFVHMIQHLLLTLIIPPLFLMAVPEWLARLIVSKDGSTGIWVRRLTRPVVAAVVFNLLVALTHMTHVVNFSVENGIFHYFVHLTVFTAALLMWMPVVSPLPELRASYPGRMIFLFLNSVLPTVPGGFLTFAEDPLYRVYDHSERLWGITAVDDQQAAGLIMKLGGGAFIWTVITILFFTWARKERETGATTGRPTAPRRPRTPVVVPDAPDGEQLTFEDVATAFERAGEPVSE